MRGDTTTGQWDTIPYELARKPTNASWIGLSEVTLVGDDLVFIERDNRTGAFTETKNLVRLTLDDVFDADGITRDEKQRADLIRSLRSTNGWISDKPEGFAVTAAGNAFVVTDNDGREDWSGESQRLRLGRASDLFDWALRKSDGRSSSGTTGYGRVVCIDGGGGTLAHAAVRCAPVFLDHTATVEAADRIEPSPPVQPHPSGLVQRPS